MDEQIKEVGRVYLNLEIFLFLRLFALLNVALLAAFAGGAVYLSVEAFQRNGQLQRTDPLLFALPVGLAVFSVALTFEFRLILRRISRAMEYSLAIYDNLEATLQNGSPQVALLLAS